MIWEQIVNLAISNGLFAVLFLGLLVYQLKDSRSREKKYQDRKDFCTSQINSLLELINNLQEEIAELKGLENESAND